MLKKWDFFNNFQTLWELTREHLKKYSGRRWRKRIGLSIFTPSRIEVTRLFLCLKKTSHTNLSSRSRQENGILILIILSCLLCFSLCTNARPCVSMVSLDGGEGRGECGLMPQKPVGEGKTLTFCSFGGTHALESSSLAQLFCNTHQHSNGH